MVCSFDRGTNHPALAQNHIIGLRRLCFFKVTVRITWAVLIEAGRGGFFFFWQLGRVRSCIRPIDAAQPGHWP